MSEKNFRIKQSQSRIFDQQATTYTSSYQETPKETTSFKYSYFKTTKSRPDHFSQHRQDIQNRIKSIWEISSMIGIEISQAVILKYIKKTMQLKSYQYSDLIFQTIKTKRLPKTFPKVEQIKMIPLIYEYDKIKKQVQQFLWRRFCKDIEIMQDRIKLADFQLRDHIQLQKYKTLTCSFRPLLVSTESNLVKEYYNINGNSTQNIHKIQHLRYNKLAEFSQNISKLHNFVCKEKQSQKLFIG